ncbi:MAG TPA: CehA/McbA family metallohydrolase, partial [Jiangellales bacterium]|nr:CehA/McbA family metallohydrolase [Jiangellales bacterium]
ARLDFIATTEHNTSDAHRAWGSLADGLLVILGQEVTTRTGHWLALGIDPGEAVDWRYGLRDDVVDRHLNQVSRAGGLCVAAHPHAPYPSGVFMYPYQKFDVVEVWNGLWTSDLPWNADNEAALAEWGRAPWSGRRVRRSRRSSASRCVIRTAPWRRSPTRSS